MIVDITSRDYFDELRLRVRAAGLRGDLEEALALCDEAQVWAEQHGDQDDVDLVCCNRHAILIYRGEGGQSVRHLQTILMRSTSSTCRHLAAYNISLYYDSRDDVEKQYFYANLALESAQKSDSDIFLANSYNRLGNLLIRESKFTLALENYRKAVHLYGKNEHSFEQLALLTNIGYCHLAGGRTDDGFRYLFTVRRNYIRLKMKLEQPLCRLRLSFCFGYLEVGKPRLANLHGAAGLRIAEACNDQDLVKKALYLLGEAKKLAGDQRGAYTHFARLQEDFYPDTPTLPDLLLDHDTKQLVNLWA